MASSVFPTLVTGVTVETATNGALSGDGSSGNKLAVQVDGTSIGVNGSNQLEALGGGNPFDQSLNTDDDVTFAGVTLGNDGLTVGTPQFSVFSWPFSGFDPSADPLHTFVQEAATFTEPLSGSDSYGEFQVAHLAVASINPDENDPSYNSYHGIMGVASTPSANDKLISEINAVTAVANFASTGNTSSDGYAIAFNGSTTASAPVFTVANAFLTATVTNEVDEEIGVINTLNATGMDAHVAAQFGAYQYLLSTGGALVDAGYGSYVIFAPDGGGIYTDLFGYYVADVAGKATNPYYDWFDSRGVAATREEFSQAVTRLYNPEVTKYTPGAADYERIFYGRWGQTGDYGTDNIGYIGAEAGGTGTLRNLNILGAEVGIMSIPGTYATVRAGGYKSSDGTAGASGTFSTVTVKDGLVVSGS